MAAQRGGVGRQVYRKDQEREEQVENRGHHGRKRRFQKYKEEKIERRQWRIRDRELELTSQTLYEQSGVTYSILGQVKFEPKSPGSTNHHEGAHSTGDKKCLYPHSMVSFQERFTYISLIKSASMRYKEPPLPDTLARKSRTDVMLKFQLDFKEANGLN